MITLQALLGTELPLIQAPMAGVQGSALAIAVSNAGGLGSLPCAMLSLEALRNELVALRAGTRRPYNVNFFCHTHPLPDAARDAAWRDALGSLQIEATEPVRRMLYTSLYHALMAPSVFRPSTSTGWSSSDCTSINGSRAVY